MTDAKKLSALSFALSAVLTGEPGIKIEADGETVLIGFWYETATGRKYTCAIKPTLQEAYLAAKQKRLAEIETAKVEAEVRREVEARMTA